MENVYLQRRYLLSFESRRLPHIFTDVLVIGSGGGGLRAAIEAAQYAEVILVTKAKTLDSNSFLAQGGLAAVLDPNDSLEAHIADTVNTACGIGDAEVIEHVVRAAPEHIRQMQQWGCPFDTDGERMLLAREGGHSANRVVHADGDATGKALTQTLVSRLGQTPNIKIFEQCFLIDLITDPSEGSDGETCIGALTYNPRYGLQIIRAKQTILAAGGAGTLWRETSNSPQATADAMAAAFRAGVLIADAEMMQFHPTTLYVAGATRSLISEAVRGEGAYLVDRDGHRFMEQYDSKLELAPRDVVSRAILDKCTKTSTTHVFLDVRHIDGFAERFPSIDIQCRSFDINPRTDLIPVHPAAHYMIGGVEVDMDGRTSLKGLFACGEASCTGLHGANRLASNSLIEVLIFAQRCGQLAGQASAEMNDKLLAKDINWPRHEPRQSQLDLTDIRNSLRSLMWRNVGIRRDCQGLSEALDIIYFWGRYVLDKEFYSLAGWEIQNMLTASYLITECALRRTETRGVHFRGDFPATDPHWARHQHIRRTEHQLVVE